VSFCVKYKRFLNKLTLINVFELTPVIPTVVYAPVTEVAVEVPVEV
jgi:hypothetical protein